MLNIQSRRKIRSVKGLSLAALGVGAVVVTIFVAQSQEANAAGNGIRNTPPPVRRVPATFRVHHIQDNPNEPIVKTGKVSQTQARLENRDSRRMTPIEGGRQDASDFQKELLALPADRRGSVEAGMIEAIQNKKQANPNFVISNSVKPMSEAWPTIKQAFRDMDGRRVTVRENLDSDGHTVTYRVDDVRKPLLMSGHIIVTDENHEASNQEAAADQKVPRPNLVKKVAAYFSRGVTGQQYGASIVEGTTTTGKPFGVDYREVGGIFTYSGKQGLGHPNMENQGSTTSYVPWAADMDGKNANGQQLHNVYTRLEYQHTTEPFKTKAPGPLSPNLTDDFGMVQGKYKQNIDGGNQLEDGIQVLSRVPIAQDQDQGQGQGPNVV